MHRFSKSILIAALVALAPVAGPRVATAQVQPPQRVVRGYIPPDQLVSFLPSTAFDTFIELLNPTFERITTKTIIDPDSRTIPIGIPITTMHFFDALQQVLYHNGLTYRETDRYFMVQVPPPPDPSTTQGVAAADAGRVSPAGAGGSASQGGAANVPATLATRQVLINAIVFEVNLTKSREIGLDWSSILGARSGSSSGSTGGSTGGTSSSSSQDKVTFYLKTDELFRGVEDLIEAPDKVNFASINSILRFAESEGLGETLGAPHVTVISGIQGSMQVGADVPVLQRDFAGNTTTEFFKTGLIIDVTPTIISQPIADTVGAPVVDFIHMTVKVEKSGSRPTVAGITIDRSDANTQIVVLDGEQVVIGGLYSTDESYSRSGIPFLKDLPPWFFGLRYLFGRTVRNETKKELIMVLEAHIQEPILARMERAFESDVLEAQRAQIRDALSRMNARLGARHSEGGDRK